MNGQRALPGALRTVTLFFNNLGGQLKDVRTYFATHQLLAKRLHAGLHVAYFVCVFTQTHAVVVYVAGALAIMGVFAVIDGGEV